MTRRRFTALDRLKVMVRQALCPLCGEKLGRLDDTEFDHIHALALGGEDTIENLRAVHTDCHKAKTHGSRASRAGSDRHTLKKVRRMEGDRLERQRRLLAKDDKPKPTRKSRWDKPAFEPRPPKQI
ncbi:MAG: HNH endonuclease signature motif containing protein [Pseudomonadota bacterium]